MKKLYFVTSNKGKISEAQKIFEDFDIEIIQKNLGYPEIQSDKLENVAMYGVNYLRKKLKKAFIIEDAGLFIDVLNKFPGVYSSYVYRTIGLNGILKLIKDFRDNKLDSLFKSVIALNIPGKHTKLFIGICQGKISNEIIGNNGFGYDPIFIPKGEEMTFAQMSTITKNRLSHRGKSFNKLIRYLRNE
jgi:XTP/dITP diphosphohydrolase